MVVHALRRLLLTGAWMLWALPALAQPQPGAPAPEPVLPTAVPTAPVVIDGMTLFRVRGISAFPPEARARGIVDRIRAFADNPALAADGVQLDVQADYTNINAGTIVLTSLIDADGEVEGVTRAVLAEVYRRQIVSAVTTYRADRQPEALVRGALTVGGVFLVLAAVLLLLSLAFRRVQALVSRRLKSRVRDVESHWFRFLRGGELWSGVQAALRMLHLLLAAAAVLVFARTALVAFPWTRSLGSNLGNVVLEPLALIGQGFIDHLPNLIFIAILTIVTRWVLGFIRLFFEAAERGVVQLPSFDPEWALPTYRLVRVGVVAFTVVMAFPYIPGSDTDAFRGVTVFLGLVFSLGSSSIIGNVIAGYSMTYRRAFRIGDRVRVGDHLGDVVEIRLLVTRLRTPKNEEVIVPNSEILNHSVINYSTMAREGKLILHTTVGIGYETPWRQVEAMLLEAARRTEGLLDDPAPYVLQKNLGDFAIAYEINAPCADAHIMGVIYTRLHRNILDIFNEHGVQIMTPAYEGDPDQPKVVPKDQWFLPPAAPPPAGS
jgi:small-conductance mechanosensitive channel